MITVSQVVRKLLQALPSRPLGSALLASALLLGSCGGGSGGEGLLPGGGNSVPASSNPEATNTPSTQTALDAGVPASTAASIQKVVTLAGSAALGSNVALPVNPVSGESMLLAIDGSGNIWLASLTSSATTVLSSSSTALALVRLASGNLGEGQTAKSMNDAISTAPDFQALVAAIGHSLHSAVAPSSSADVVKLVAVVMNEAHLRIAPSNSKSQQKIIDPALKPPLPAVALDSSLVGLSLPIAVKDTGPSGQIYLVNSMPIAWEATSSSYSGTDIEKVQMPANTVSGILIGKLAPSTISATQLQGDGGKSFNLRIAQSAATQAQTMLAIEVDILSTLIPYLPTAIQCGQFAETLLLSPSPELQTLRDHPSFDALVAYLKEVLPNATQIAGIFDKCYPTTPKDAVAGLLGSVSTFILSLSDVPLKDAASAAAKIAYLGHFWGAKSDAGVCLGTTPNTTNIALADCVATFRFDPSPAHLVPGAFFTPELTALDVRGRTTLLPSGLVFTTDDQSGSIIQFDSGTGQITGKAAGTATITVKDPATEKSGSFTTKVVDPVISPPQATMAEGDNLGFMLTDGNGDKLIVHGAGTKWALSDTTLAALNPLLALLTSEDSIPVSATKAGKVDLTATNPVSGKVATSNIEITSVGAKSLKVYPTGVAIPVGQSIKLTVQLLDQSGKSLPLPSDFQWSTDSTSTASVADGTVAGIGIGNAVITASAASTKLAPAHTSVTVTGPDDCSKGGCVNGNFPAPENSNNLIFMRSIVSLIGAVAVSPRTWAAPPPSLDGLQIQTIELTDSKGFITTSLRDFWYCIEGHQSCIDWANGATNPNY